MTMQALAIKLIIFNFFLLFYPVRFLLFYPVRFLLVLVLSSFARVSFFLLYIFSSVQIPNNPINPHNPNNPSNPNNPNSPNSPHFPNNSKHRALLVGGNRGSPEFPEGSTVISTRFKEYTDTHQLPRRLTHFTQLNTFYTIKHSHTVKHILHILTDFTQSSTFYTF
jgi:hypothetical protein